MDNPHRSLSLALYARVSGDEQAERGTIAGQSEWFARWADLHGHRSAGEYLDDGVAGVIHLAQRPAGARLLADLEAGRLQHVAVTRLDRLGRDPRVVLAAVEAIEQRGGTIRSLTEPFDTTSPAGRLMLTMLAGFAGFERESIAERATIGQRRAAREGRWVGGAGTAYAYRVEGRRHHSRLALDTSPVPEFEEGATRVDVARFIFERMAAGDGSVSVAAELNARAVPGPKGPRWHPAALVRMVRNPVYRGQHQYGDHPGTVLPRITADAPAVVSPELWHQAQAAIDANRRKQPGNAHRSYLLRGLLHCDHCGSTYTGQTTDKQLAVATCGQRGTIYRCNARSRGTGCPGRAIPGSIEEIVWRRLLDWAAHPEVIERLIPIPEIRGEGDAPADQPPGLDIANERAALLRLYRQGRIGDADLDQQLAELDQAEALRQAAIRAAREATGARAAALAQRDRLAGALARLNAGRNDSTPPETRRAVISGILAQIRVKTTGDGVSLIFVFRSAATHPEGQVNLLQMMSCEWDLTDEERRVLRLA